MSDTVSTRPDAALLGVPARIRSLPPLPVGYGLLLGAIASIGLWAGLIAGIARLFA